MKSRTTIPLGSPRSSGILPIISFIVIGILLIITLWYIREAPVPLKFP